MQRRVKLSPAQKAKILQMWQAGEKGEYIAAIIGCSVQTVYVTAAKAGLRRSRGRPALITPTVP